MPCGWGGNRRSGVALAMHHRLEWFIYLRAPGLRKDDEHGSWGMTLTVTFTTREHTHTHPFNGPSSRTIPGSADTRKVKPIWILLKQETVGHMQVCALLQTDNHAGTPPLSFLQAGSPSCRPTNSVKTLKANFTTREVSK